MPKFRVLMRRPEYAWFYVGAEDAQDATDVAECEGKVRCTCVRLRQRVARG